MHLYVCNVFVDDGKGSGGLESPLLFLPCDDIMTIYEGLEVDSLKCDRRFAIRKKNNQP